MAVECTFSDISLEKEREAFCHPICLCNDRVFGEHDLF